MLELLGGGFPLRQAFAQGYLDFLLDDAERQAGPDRKLRIILAQRRARRHDLAELHGGGKSVQSESNLGSFVAEDGAEVAIYFRIALKSLHRPLVARGTLKEKTFSAQRLFDHALHRAGIIRGNEPVGRAHDGRVAGVVDQGSEWLAVELVEPHD